MRQLAEDETVNPVDEGVRLPKSLVSETFCCSRTHGMEYGFTFKESAAGYDSVFDVVLGDANDATTLENGQAKYAPLMREICRRYNAHEELARDADPGSVANLERVREECHRIRTEERTVESMRLALLRLATSLR